MSAATVGLGCVTVAEPDERPFLRTALELVGVPPFLEPREPAPDSGPPAAAPQAAVSFRFFLALRAAAAALAAFAFLS